MYMCRRETSAVAVCQTESQSPSIAEGRTLIHSQGRKQFALQTEINSATTMTLTGAHTSANEVNTAKLSL